MPTGAPSFASTVRATCAVAGGTVAFNVLDRGGAVVPYALVEAVPAQHGVAIRGGCFCNPGAAEAAFRLPASDVLRCLTSLADEAFAPRKLADCLGGGIAVGAVRASVGLATTDADVRRGVDVLASAVGA